MANSRMANSRIIAPIVGYNPVPGTFVEPDESWIYLTEGDATINKATDGSLLCKVTRQAISAELCKAATEAYMDAGKMVSTNRGYAAGLQGSRLKKRSYDRGIAATTGIIGYMNSTNHKRPCRLTAYSRDNLERYLSGLPFIQRVSELYAQYAAMEYDKQRNKANCSPDFIIPNTVFSTVTVNYNFQTALHKDQNDFKDGLGNICVISENVEGGLLLFPEYKVAIALNTGDHLLADVHEWHCNTPIHYTASNGYRLSFVCYLRDKIEDCDSVNRRLFALNGNLTNELWDTNKAIADIFQGDTPIKDIIPNGWKMTSFRFILTYKNKRYTLLDNIKNIKIHNLMPAWEYARRLQETLEHA